MTPQTTQIPVSLIILDETIYPRKAVNIRVSNFFSIFEKSSGHKGNIVIIREAWMLLAQKNGH
jgi:hypothetical protein